MKFKIEHKKQNMAMKASVPELHVIFISDFSSMNPL